MAGMDFNPTFRENLKEADFDYKYPEGLDLRPGSELHDRLRDEVFSRTREAHNEMTKRYDVWRRTDNTLRVYIRQDAAEKNLKNQDERKPTSIVIPISTAILETILTQLVGIFLNNPMFRCEGVGPEDTIKSLLMEKVMEIMTIKSKVALSLHTMFRDWCSYGMGAVATTWNVKHGYKSVIQQSQKKLFGFFGPQILMGEKTRSNKKTILWEGVGLLNINPRHFYPDPSVAVQDVQRGEFVNYLDPDNLVSLKSQEAYGEGEYFNVKYLKFLEGKRSIFIDSETAFGTGEDARNDFAIPTGGIANADSTINPVDVIYSYVDLVPKEWKLGSSEEPEKWLFALASDEIIIRAQPLGLNHDMFPIAVCAPGFDGYSTHFPSPMELIDGMQMTINALFNLQIASQRKGLNDALVVDPNRVDLKSLKKPGPGKMIFLKNTLLPGTAKDAVFQLNTIDMSARNIPDSSYLFDIAMRTTGATDVLQGSGRQTGERRTATEVRDTFNAAIGRMTKDARIISLMAMQDIGTQFVSMIQQLMDQELYVKITGETEQRLKSDYSVQNERVLVAPTDLVGSYDIVLHDGTSPNPNYADVWLQMFQMISSNPLLAQQFNIVKIFQHMARMMGAKNIDEFIIKNGPVNSQVVPDEAAQQQVDRGNLIPIGGNGGGETDAGRLNF